MRHVLCCAVFLCLAVGSQWIAKGAEVPGQRSVAAAYWCCCAATRRVAPVNIAEMRDADDVQVAVAAAPIQEEMEPRERCVPFALRCADGSIWFFKQMREGIIVRVVFCRPCLEEELARRQEPDAAQGGRQDDECSECVSCIDGCYMDVLNGANRCLDRCLPVAASTCEPCHMKQCTESTVRCCVCAGCCPVATTAAIASLPCIACCLTVMLAGSGGGSSG